MPNSKFRTRQTNGSVSTFRFWRPSASTDLKRLTETARVTTKTRRHEEAKIRRKPNKQDETASCLRDFVVRSLCSKSRQKAELARPPSAEFSRAQTEPTCFACPGAALLS